MPNNFHSDRQRLLKLIVGDSAALKSVESKKGLTDTSRKTKEIIFVSKERVKGFFRKIAKGEISFSNPSSIPVNRIFAVILAVMSAYLVMSFIGTTLFMRGNIIPPTAKLEAGKGRPFTELSPLSYYLDRAAGKDIFNPQRLASAPVSEEASSSAESFSGLKLVGIDWGEQPVALIEDAQLGKTYFVKKGDTIKEAKVVEILRDKVRVSHYNKLIELK